MGSLALCRTFPGTLFWAWPGTFSNPRLTGTGNDTKPAFYNGSMRPIAKAASEPEPPLLTSPHGDRTRSRPPPGRRAGARFPRIAAMFPQRNNPTTGHNGRYRTLTANNQLQPQHQHQHHLHLHLQHHLQIQTQRGPLPAILIAAEMHG